jgi:hypothetical protein
VKQRGPDSDKPRDGEAAESEGPTPGRPAPGRQDRFSTEVQLKAGRARAAAGGDDSRSALETAARGVEGRGEPLPHAGRIQEAFGHFDVSGVTAHTGPEAASAARELGARAYATGEDVAFAETPDLHTSAHEAAHTVQQRQGVSLAGGVGAAGDAYEKNADAVADRVVAGESAVDLLESVAPGAARARSGAVQRQAVQLDGEDGSSPAPAGADGDGAADAGSDRAYADFAMALNSKDLAKAKSAWAKCSAKDKQKLKTDTAVARNLVWSFKKDAPKYLAEAKHDLSGLTYTILQVDDFEHWRAPLKTAKLFDDFIQGQPRKHQVSKENAIKLAKWLTGASDADSFAVFEKVYPKLNKKKLDTAWRKEKVAQWTQPTIKRLYDALSGYIPVGHAQTITGGFTLVEKHKRKEKGKWWKSFKTLGYGWWEPNTFRCVMPHRSSTGGGGITHDMTGGTGSGSSSAYDVSDGAGGTTPGTNTSLNHFAGTALHEVGHGVGQRMGGDAYALDSSQWPGFTHMSAEQFVNDLWVGSGIVGSAPAVHGDAKLNNNDAKGFVRTELENGKNSWSSWTNDASRKDIRDWVLHKYGNKKAVKFWERYVENGADKKEAYTWNNPARRKGTWVYGLLARWNASTPYAKFRNRAWTDKVSWYSLSSPKEWFAEQYAHYYRTEKTGGPQMDKATKALLDKLDKQQFIARSDGSGAAAPMPGGSDAAGAGSGDEAAGSEAGGEPEERPLMFPW